MSHPPRHVPLPQPSRGRRARWSRLAPAAALGLALTTSACGMNVQTTNPYTPAIGVNFDGTAKSVIFSGAANYIGFDNITLGSATAGAPEPGTWAFLLILASVGAWLIRRRPRVGAFA